MVDGARPTNAERRRKCVDSNFTAGWEHTQSAPGAPDHTQGLIAVNWGAVFSTQTNLTVCLAAPFTEDRREAEGLLVCFTEAMNRIL